jgi:hypothetical protein
MGMEAVKVSTRKDLKEFIDLPWMIYRDFPHWVPPLKAEVEKMVTPGKYPFWQHAERELFVVRKEGQAVGRIAAIRDDNHDRIHQEKAGFFGRKDASSCAARRVQAPTTNTVFCWKDSTWIRSS